jgi:type IV conjugative transfer system protein TraE
MSFEFCSDKNQNKILALLLLISLLSNTYLVLKLCNQNKTVIMVPSLEREVSVGEEFVSADYLSLRALQVMELLFNIRNENFDYNLNQILRQVSSKNKADFREQLEIFAADVRSKQYFYVFNKESIELDTTNLAVVFTGSLETFISNKLVATTPKRYRLTFINNSGLVTLTSFEDISNDKI